jgi:hypothetical protein
MKPHSVSGGGTLDIELFVEPGWLRMCRFGRKATSIGNRQLHLKASFPSTIVREGKLLYGA